MTEREVANFSGLDYDHQLGTATGYSRKSGLEVGTEYNISQAWQRLRQQEDAAQKLENVSKTLTALADLVTQTKVAYTSATVEGGAL